MTIISITRGVNVSKVTALTVWHTVECDVAFVLQ